METPAAHARAVITDLQQQEGLGAARRSRWVARSLSVSSARRPVAESGPLRRLRDQPVQRGRARSPSGAPRWKRALWRSASRVVYAVLRQRLDDHEQLLDALAEACETLAHRIDELERDLVGLGERANRSLSDLAEMAVLRSSKVGGPTSPLRERRSPAGPEQADGRTGTAPPSAGADPWPSR